MAAAASRLQVKKEAFVHVAYERNAKRLLAELDFQRSSRISERRSSSFCAQSASAWPISSTRTREGSCLPGWICRYRAG
jgi:hypothetical protein